MSPEEKKERARERARAYYYANKERCLERGRAWRAENKGKVKANNAAYLAEHREQEIERNRKWKDKNRDTMNARRRAKYAANIEEERAYARDRKKARYTRNPQKYRDLARLDRAAPSRKAQQAALSRAWAERNRGRTKAAARRWYQCHLVHARLQLAISQASRRQRRVLWADRDAIAEIYAEAARLTRTTGRAYVVDHVIPLKGRAVSGLHVENNLRVIERLENARKSNKWEPSGWESRSGDMPLISGDDQPRQLDLF